MNESAHQPQYNILVIDDTPANLRLLTNILNAQGYKVRPVTSGVMAIKSAKIEPPNLVLLDIKMPQMSGYEVCEQLKADERTRDIPVIFISALDDILDKVKAFSFGGVDYITKPFQSEEVVARVKTHLTLRHLQQQLQDTNHLLERNVKELAASNAELQKALDTIKTLKGLLRICAWCRKKIRDEKDQWVPLESYIEEHSEAVFSHGICPECREKLMGEWERSKEQQSESSFSENRR